MRSAPRGGTSPGAPALAGPRGPGSLCWPGGRPPGTPRMRFAPRGGTSPAHRRSPGREGPARCAGPGGDPPEPPACASRPAVVLRRHTGARRAARARLAVLARGATPRSPPHALRAPRWYLAGTPALAGPRGPGSLAGCDRLAVTRCCAISPIPTGVRRSLPFGGPGLAQATPRAARRAVSRWYAVRRRRSARARLAMPVINRLAVTRRGICRYQPGLRRSYPFNPG